MALFSVSNIGIKGISAAVPKNTVSNYDLAGFGEEELKKLISTIGIDKRREAGSEICASDLSVSSACALIEKLNWKKEDIGVLVFVTQTPDYLIPGTSFHIKERLGLAQNCIAFDLNQGCAAYVYGMAMISAFMNATKIKKGLLLVGDTITKLIANDDKSLKPIFSDCGTATALAFDEKAEPFHFNLSSNGDLFESIIVENGGGKNPIKEPGTAALLSMKGLEVFNFSITKVVPNISELLNHFKCAVQNVDLGIFHQANALIVDAIAKKINLDKAKVMSSLKDFGNTSGASIPLTMLINANSFNIKNRQTLLLCGFGVGLSIGSMLVNTNEILFCDLIEI